MRSRLVALRAECLAIDDELAAAHRSATLDALLIERLRSRRRRVLEEIARLEDGLYPNLTA